MIQMPGVVVDYAELSEGFAIFSRFPSSKELLIEPQVAGAPFQSPLVGFLVAVSVDPVDVGRRDRRRLEELGWNANEPEARFDRLYEAPPS